MTTKIILLADLHIVPDCNACGDTPLARLQAAVDDILSHHADAAAVIILGDIADKGDVASYRLAANALSRLPVPFYLLPGNHDNRDNMRLIFPGLRTDFIQQIVTTPAGDFILLDSVREGEDAGEFCYRRSKWLKKILRSARRRVFICMHHPPLLLPFLQDSDFVPDYFKYLADALAEAPGMVRYFLFGHQHASVGGVWRGIPFSVLRSTYRQTYFTTASIESSKERFAKVAHHFGSTEAAPHYGILLADEERIIFHHHGFLENIPIIAG